MTRIDRYKILIRFAVSNGIAANQRELGRLLGYNNESSFSQIINEKVERPKEFISKLKSLIPNLNVNWIDTGEGDMIISDSKQSANGNHIQQFDHSPNSGNHNNSYAENIINKALDEIAAQRRVTEQTQSLLQEAQTTIREMTATNTQLTAQLLSLFQTIKPQTT